MRRGVFSALFVLFAITTLVASLFVNPLRTWAYHEGNTATTSGATLGARLVNRRTGQTI